MKKIIELAIIKRMQSDENFNFIVRQGSIIYQKIVKGDLDSNVELVEVAENLINQVIMGIIGNSDEDAQGIIYELMNEKREWASFE